MSDSEFQVDHNKFNFNGLVYVRKPRVTDQDYSIVLRWSISQSFGAVEGWVGGFNCFTSFATVKVISKTGHCHGRVRLSCQFVGQADPTFPIVSCVTPRAKTRVKKV